MMWIVVVLLFLFLTSDAKPAPTVIDRERVRVEAALADAPHRVLRFAGLSVDGDPAELSRTNFVPDPSSINNGSV
jgi:hypothetical protein